ncbi:M23 family metallopeptidase [Nocardioides sp. GY 10127]|uniref:M23 family metallopeptidase n=1 Tax=Nocardioides sp. GY 10127 TaxID=2569762 RepID=UPI0010A94786|nr:M23 family metallopeptidase [Nocardioides sp. GY 10127]TIC86376.1 M23 family metallopeptidase [Nocardioides sp. GY 10127]
MSRLSVALVITTAVIGGITLIGLPAVMVMSVMGGSNDSDSSCTSGDVVLAGSSATQGLDDSQSSIAATIIAEGRRLGVSARGQVVALAVAAQESRFTVYANDGTGELQPDQAGIERSLDLPHTAVGSDHGSLGVFQQQWPWWGSMQELMDPATSARLFYQRLLAVPGWQDMEIGDAGQQVQSSAYPDAYDDDVLLAEALVSSSSSAGTELTGYFGSIDPTSCGVPVADGDVVFPLAPGTSYVDQENFGGVSSFWSTTHTGTDFSTACGGTVLAATSGVVHVDTTEAWSGTWLVEIDSGAVVTWYAHMQAIEVEDGQQVSAGQVIGAVGDLGNSTGCHLHFEVRSGDGDPVDPTDWLLEHVGSDRGSAVPVVDAEPPSLQQLRVAVIPTGARTNLAQALNRSPDVLVALDATTRTPLAAPWSTIGGGNGPLIVWNADQLSLLRSGPGKTGGDATWAMLRTDAGTLPVLAGTKSRALGQLINAMTSAGYPPLIAASRAALARSGLDEGAASCGSVAVNGDPDYLRLAAPRCAPRRLSVTVAPAEVP